jgi:4-amino-4-deoxy-L-arabinose transferase-like glycosyltransferase
LLVGSGLLYLVNLGASGWANAFYAAAAQAGAQSWKAFFFGSSDAANSITVDKPPASLWVMDLSVRIFGLNPWSLLVPQALMGVAAVWVLFATVRRWYGPGAGLLAGAILALTPVAVLMFRYNNPDALLTLLLVVAAYACVRAIESGATRWLVLIGALVGFGFLTKMLQAFLVVPGFGLAYLVAAPGPVHRRLSQLAAGLGALVVSAGWWVAIVDALPVNDRPFIGGSQTNSALELTLGYNGFGRITGAEAGAIGTWWGPTGIDRLFTADFAAGISWLLPAALALLAAGLIYSGRAPRTDRRRAGFLVWGSWLLATWLTFSFMNGILHAYYNVALAPPVAAVCGMGAIVLWRRRDAWALLILGAVVSATGAWGAVLLGVEPNFLPWLSPLVMGLGVGAGLGLAGLAVTMLVRERRAFAAGRRPNLDASRHEVGFDAALRPAAAAVLVLGLVAGLAAPIAYSLATAATPHEGAIPEVGPVNRTVAQGPIFGAGGGLVDATQPTALMVSMLGADADRYEWAAATVGSNNAAGYQLASGHPVMPIGGFNDSDPFPTVAQFEELVAQRRIHYFIDSYRFRNVGGSEDALDISNWVFMNYAPIRVDGVDFYDLSGPAAYRE